MIVTEEEAKTKRCQESFPAAEGLSLGGFVEHVPLPPHAVSFSSSPGGSARQTAPTNCIGSACMAWRWMFPNSPNHVDKTQGFCGKAGRP